jgi:hypothetical protein
VVAGNNTADFDTNGFLRVVKYGAVVQTGYITDVAGLHRESTDYTHAPDNATYRTYSGYLTGVNTAGALGRNRAIVVDTAAPTAPTTVILNQVGGNNKFGTTTITNKLNGTNTSATLEATITAGATQAVGGKAEFYYGTTLLGTDNTISITDTKVTLDLGLISTAELQAMFPTGGNLTVKLYDFARNSATSLATALAVDYVAPIRPTLTVTGTDTGGSATDRITNSTTLTFAISGAEPASRNIYFDNDVLLPTWGSLNSASGAWSNAASAGLIADGTHVWTVASVDEAGNVSDISVASPAWTIDTTLPTITNLIGKSADGLYKAGDTIEFYANFSEAVWYTTAPSFAVEHTPGNYSWYPANAGAGTNQLTVPYTVAAGHNSADLNLINGTSFSGTVTDLAGNIRNATNTTPVKTSPQALASNAAYVIDGIAPTTAGTPVLTFSGGTVVANKANASNTNATVTATIGAAQATGGYAVLRLNGVEIFRDSTILAGDTSVFFDFGATSAEELQAILGAGGNLTMTVYDLAGNSLTSSALALTGDYVAPNKPVITTVTTDTGKFSDDWIINTSTATVNGTAEPSSTVYLYKAGVQVGTATANATTGAWSIASGTMTNGSTNVFTAKAEDASKNMSEVSENYSNSYLMIFFSFGLIGFFSLIIYVVDLYKLNINKGYFIVFLLVLLSDQILFNRNFFYLVSCIYFIRNTNLDASTNQYSLKVFTREDDLQA